MKEKLQEIYEGLQERLKSPFLITFIIVWSIHNWDLVYAVLTFEETIGFVKRYAFVKAYLRTYGSYHLLWFPVFWAFISLGIYLIASFLSEGINLVYSKWIRTFLYWAIDRNKLKTETDYNDLEKRRTALQELVHDLKRKEEDASLKLSASEKRSKEEYAILLERETNFIKENETLLSENKKLRSEVDNVLKQNDDLKEEAEKLKDVRKRNNELLNELKSSKEMIEKEKNNNKDYRHAAHLVLFNSTFKNHRWRNDYTYANGETGHEYFALRKSDPPIFDVENRPSFNISHINFGLNDELTFIKTNMQTNKSFNVVLNVSDPNRLKGIENDNIKVIYSKQ